MEEVKKIATLLIAVYLSLLGLLALLLLKSPIGSFNKFLQGLYSLFHSQPKLWIFSIFIFLASYWVLAFGKLLDMAYHLVGRKLPIKIFFLLLYLTPHILLIVSRGYHSGVHLMLAITIMGFPYLFPRQAIKNPIQKNKHGIQLLGKGGQLLPLNAPELGIFIVGSPGCGKTKYVIEPLLYKLITQGYSGLLYDYDFSAQKQGKNYSLTHLAYHCCQNFSKSKIRFLSINFQELESSSRINPIAPSCIKDRQKLSHILHTLLLNMNPQMSHKEDFWYKNTYSLLKSLVIFFSNHYPSFCTLPHVIIAGLQPIKPLMQILQQDAEAELTASPILDAYHHAPEQLAGVIANFKVSLERLLDPYLFWVLSSDDTPSVINDPDAPMLVCLGNTPTKKKGLSPVISMILAYLSTNMYEHGRHKSFLMLDELPTLLLPDLVEVPATARKYGIATIVALQNMAQLEKSYGTIGALELQDTFSNHFIGRSSFKLAKELSDRVGKQEVKSTSRTISSHQKSQTIHEKESLILKPQEIMNLAVGEFVGGVAASDQGFFRMQMRPISHYHQQLDDQLYAPLPKTSHRIDAHQNVLKIQQEVAELVRISTPNRDYTK